MKQYIYSIILALAGFIPVNAQLSFTVSGEYYGNCGGQKNEIQNRFNSIMSQYKTQATGIRSSAECEKLRAEVNGISHNYNFKGFNCGFRLKAGPCTGRPIDEHVISLGQVNIQGPEQGSSFFSTNGADEIQNWSEDDMKRRLALDKSTVTSEPTNISTGDPEFDKARNDYEFTGRMPAGSISLIKKEKLTPRPENSSVPYIGDGIFKGIQKPISSPDLDMSDTKWEFIKSTKNLPYKTVEEFAERTSQQNTSILDDILNLANMPPSTLEYNLKQCTYDIEGWYNSESIRLAKELENAERLHDIANYMLQYKGYLAITYINGMSDNPAAADNAARKAFGKTRDELAYESIEKMEQDLLTKYGMSKDDIAKLKKVINDDNIVQEYVSKAKGLALDDIGQKGVEAISEKMTDKGFNIDFGQGEVSISKALDLGVLLNNDIALLGLSKNEKALANYIQSVKDRQTIIKEVRDNETQKIGDLLTIVENNTQEMKSGVSKMSQRDKLDWANNANDILGRVNSRKEKDSYEIFPDRFREMYIREGTFIELRGK